MNNLNLIEYKTKCKICGYESDNEWKLSLHIRQIHNLNKELYVRQYIFNNETQYCLCGCGEECTILKRYPFKYDFKKGHNAKGKFNPMYGKKFSDETKQKMHIKALQRIENNKLNNIISPWHRRDVIDKRCMQHKQKTIKEKEKKYNIKINSSIDEINNKIYKFTCNKCNMSDIQYHSGYFICKYCNSIEQSKEQTSLVDFIKNELKLKIIENSRSIVNGLEFDIVIPDKRVCIEYNELYLHSEENGKTRNYHLSKTEQCEKQGYRLIQIFSDEWQNKRNIVKEKLKHILNIDNNKSKIYAKYCDIKEIDSYNKNEFLNNNHIQGKDKSKIKLGAFYKNKLISVMTFSNLSKSKGFKTTDKSYYELSRFTSDINYICVGTAGKLLKYFIKNYNPKKIISYADKRWSINANNNLYNKLNFKYIGDTPPNYWYSKDYLYRLHRFNFTKATLVKKGNNPKLTESQIMKNLKYVKIWDCGNLKYELSL